MLEKVCRSASQKGLCKWICKEGLHLLPWIHEKWGFSHRSLHPVSICWCFSHWTSEQLSLLPLYLCTTSESWNGSLPECAYLPKSNLCIELSLCLKVIVLILQILVPLDDTLENSFTPPKGSCNADTVLMPSISRLPASQAVAMDCEMVGGGKDGSVDLCARVCLVDEYESVLLDTYVQPFLPVTDYRHVFF